MPLLFILVLGMFQFIEAVAAEHKGSEKLPSRGKEAAWVVKSGSNHAAELGSLSLFKIGWITKELQ